MNLKNKPLQMALSAMAVFLLLFIFFFFAYFMPIKKEHDQIAALPSHDLTLFVDEDGNFADNGIRANGTLSYNGQACRTKEDIFKVLNDDMFVGTRGYCYFYDEQHNLYMRLGMDTYFSSGGSALFSIDEYIPFAMYFETATTPLFSGVGLGPIYAWNEELSADNSSQAGTIASARYCFLYGSLRNEVPVSIFSASLQLALAFTPYLLPLLVCLLWRSKKTILCGVGVYLLLFIINTAYYFANYPWLSW